MNLRHLMIFLEVANCKQMNQAAKNLSLSQPTVSQAILDLEKYYKTKLFDRYPRKLCITEDGKILLTHTKRLLNYYNILEETMKNPTRKHPIQIGGSVTIGTCYMGKIIKNFREKYENEKVKVIVNNTREIEKRILTNELDIGIIEGKVESSHIVVKPIKEDNLILVCGPKHKFASRESVKPFELQKENFILREEGSGTRDAFISFVENLGYNINIIWESTELEAIVQGVLNGQGITVISESLINKFLKSGELKEIKLENFSMRRNFSIIYHKNKMLSETIKNFIEITKFTILNENV